MKREHAGGKPEVASETGCYWRTLDASPKPHAVAISHFEFADLDSLSAELREMAQLGDTSRLHEMIRQAETERATEAIVRVLAIISQARKPGMLVQQILWALGRTEADGLGLKELAKRHRVTKQAFQQGAESLFAALGLDMRPGKRCLGTATNGKNMRTAGKNTFSIHAWAIRCERWLNARQHAQPISDWPPIQRAAIKRALKSIVEVYGQL